MKTKIKLLLLGFISLFLTVEMVVAQDTVETTPTSLPGFETFIFRKVGDNELRLHVVKPKGWSSTDNRPCMIFFFGGGFQIGIPRPGWAQKAADMGIIGIVPDYRTKSRFGGSPNDCRADGRSAVQWVIDHAIDLGIDPNKIICGGFSAGGDIAAWTAIPTSGPGSNDPAPTIRPIALVLLAAGTNLSTYPMPAQMPATIMFHATGDKTIPIKNSIAFREMMVKNGNRCELLTFEGLGHTFFSGGKFGAAGDSADTKCTADIQTFLISLGLVK